MNLIEEKCCTTICGLELDSPHCDLSNVGMFVTDDATSLCAFKTLVSNAEETVANESRTSRTASSHDDDWTKEFEQEEVKVRWEDE